MQGLNGCATNGDVRNPIQINQKVELRSICQDGMNWQITLDNIRINFGDIIYANEFYS